LLIGTVAFQDATLKLGWRTGAIITELEASLLNS